MMYRKIIDVCSDIDTKHKNTNVWAERRVFDLKSGGTYSNYCYKGSGKVHPRTDHQGSDEEQMCNSTFSATSKLDGGGWLPPRSEL